jgi:heme/copper-type cytochrome/quinol oxidase subunit 2
MLTNEEKQFVQYWEANRLRKKKWLRQLYLGLPLAAAFIIAIFLNISSGWNWRAEQVRNQVEQRHNTSIIPVLIIACILIVVFITIFSVRHKWDLYEQRYKELLARREKGES